MLSAHASCILHGRKPIIREGIPPYLIDHAIHQWCNALSRLRTQYQRTGHFCIRIGSALQQYMDIPCEMQSRFNQPMFASHEPGNANLLTLIRPVLKSLNSSFFNINLIFSLPNHNIDNIRRNNAFSVLLLWGNNIRCNPKQTQCEDIKKLKSRKASKQHCNSRAIYNEKRRSTDVHASDRSKIEIPHTFQLKIPRFCLRRLKQQWVWHYC